MHVKIQAMHVGRLTRIYSELAHQILVHQVFISLAILLNVPRWAWHEALPVVMQGRGMLRDVHADIVCLDLTEVIRLLVLRRELLRVVYRLGDLGRILLLYDTVLPVLDGSLI